jgi:hypothetical protein
MERWHTIRLRYNQKVFYYPENEKGLREHHTIPAQIRIKIRKADPYTIKNCTEDNLFECWYPDIPDRCFIHESQLTMEPDFESLFPHHDFGLITQDEEC